MKKYKYVITTGWWCTNDDDQETRKSFIGSNKIRTRGFFRLWLNAVNSFATPEKILIVDSASPVKPVLPDDTRIETISIDCNAGHSTNHIGKYSGVTRAHIIGMNYALTCEVDYWVYIEQDALIYGEKIIENCIENMKQGIMFGDGEGTPQPMQQSLMIIKKDKIPLFLKRLTDIKSSDNQISPEMKFAMATSRIALMLPEFLFYGWGGKNSNRFIKRKMNFIIKVLGTFDRLPIGYGRKRPINFNDKSFYFQHGNEEELRMYSEIIKIEN